MIIWDEMGRSNPLLTNDGIQVFLESKTNLTHFETDFRYRNTTAYFLSKCPKLSHL